MAFPAAGVVILGSLVGGARLLMPLFARLTDDVFLPQVLIDTVETPLDSFEDRDLDFVFPQNAFNFYPIGRGRYELTVTTALE